MKRADRHVAMRATSLAGPSLSVRVGAIVVALGATFSSALHAQPSAAGTVAPPVRADVALSGKVLASTNVGDSPACQSECKRTPGCSGYSFNRHAKANCTLLTGKLTDLAVTGAVSCRMPCAVEAAGLTARSPKAAMTAPLAVRQAASAAPALLPVAPLPMVVGTYKPPPAPAPAAAQTPATAAAQTPAPAQRSGVTGYEVVRGAVVNVAALAHTVATAQCPAGKQALSAGYRFTASGDAAFGLEVRGAIPEGQQARVWMRNANMFVAAQAQAIAVCVNAIAGLRVVDSTTESLDDRANPSQMTCSGRERVVGGGVMAGNETQIQANAPRPYGDPGGWLVTVVRASPLAGQDPIRTRVLCAPEAAVDGWQLIETAPVWLSSRQQRTLLQTCPGSKVLLAGGVVQRSGPLLDMVVNTLSPSTSVAWSTQVQNRNTLAGGPPVDAVFAAVCARSQ